jgi:hypothetical protein
MPALLNVGFPVLGTVLSLLMALFWPDVAGPPPVIGLLLMHRSCYLCVRRWLWPLTETMVGK